MVPMGSVFDNDIFLNTSNVMFSLHIIMQAYHDESIPEGEIMNLCYRASELPKEAGLPVEEI